MHIIHVIMHALWGATPWPDRTDAGCARTPIRLAADDIARGVRKALGARRTEVLWQFLMEAIFLTSTGGVLGIIFGAGIGMAVHLITGFPVSLPWWSFAIGIGFSAGIGVFFGMVPAIRASRMDPIDALRYE